MYGKEHPQNYTEGNDSCWVFQSDTSKNQATFIEVLKYGLAA